jgi:hypothetical protein
VTALDVSAVPRPRYRFPVLGDVLAIDFARPVQGLTAEVQKAGGHILEERLFNVSLTAVADTALIGEVNNEAVWEKHSGRLIGKLRPLGGDGLFTAHTSPSKGRCQSNFPFKLSCSAIGRAAFGAAFVRVSGTGYVSSESSFPHGRLSAVDQ